MELIAEGYSVVVDAENQVGVLVQRGGVLVRLIGAVRPLAHKHCVVGSYRLREFQFGLRRKAVVADFGNRKCIIVKIFDKILTRFGIDGYFPVGRNRNLLFFRAATC